MLHTKDADDYHDKGMELGNLKKSRAALVAFTRAIHIDYFAYQAKGKTYFELQMHKEAFENFNKVTKLNPKGASDHCDKGYALRRLGYYYSSIQAFNKAIELNPDYDRAYNSKGLTLNGLNRDEDALECYNKAIELEPNIAFHYNNKANTLLKLKDYEASIKAFDEAIKFGSNASYRRKQAVSALQKEKAAKQTLYKVNQIKLAKKSFRLLFLFILSYLSYYFVS